MAITRFLLDRTTTTSPLFRRSLILQSLRRLSSESTATPSTLETSSQGKAQRRYPPPPLHEYAQPCDFLGSWTRPSDPREAQANLERLRRGYAKQVKQLRKEYWYEVEMLRIEKERKDEARREAARISNEERKNAKALEAKTRAAKSLAFQQEFRQTLLKERAEKLEYWRKKMQMHEEKRSEKKELLKKQSSMWVSEEKLEDRIYTAIVDGGSL